MLRGYLETWRAIFADRAALLMLIGSVILYSVLYPSAYSRQVVQHVPVVIVDLDHSPFSRSLAGKIAAVRAVRVVGGAVDLVEAREAISSGRADAIVLIPGGAQRSLSQGAPAPVILYANGAYLNRATGALSGLGDATAAVARDAAGEQARFRGAPAPPPLTLSMRPLFNIREGYGSAVVPGVSELIIQQTMMMGIIVLAASRREAVGRLRFRPAILLAIWAAFVSLGLVTLTYFIGLIYWAQDYPRGGNPLGLLLGVPLFVGAVAAFALWLASFFKTRERPLQLLVSTSLPIFFLSGLSWPREVTPEPLNALAALLPTTAGVTMMVKFNQMGASLREAAPEMLNLAGLLLLYGGLAVWRYWPDRADRT